jgi:hypothetical protein
MAQYVLCVLNEAALLRVKHDFLGFHFLDHSVVTERHRAG